MTIDQIFSVGQLYEYPYGWHYTFDKAFFKAGNGGNANFDDVGLINASKATLIVGGNAAQSITGTTGHDFIIGGAGDDTLFGGDGNDIFMGPVGANDNFDWIKSKVA